MYAARRVGGSPVFEQTCPYPQTSQSACAVKFHREASLVPIKENGCNQDGGMICRRQCDVVGLKTFFVRLHV